jgi:hypothetical protein
MRAWMISILLLANPLTYGAVPTFRVLGDYPGGEIVPSPTGEGFLIRHRDRSTTCVFRSAPAAEISGEVFTAAFPAWDASGELRFSATRQPSVRSTGARAPFWTVPVAGGVASEEPRFEASDGSSVRLTNPNWDFIRARGLFLVRGSGRRQLSQAEDTEIAAVEIGAGGRLVGYCSSAEFVVVDLQNGQRHHYELFSPHTRIERTYHLFPDAPLLLVREGVLTHEGDDYVPGSRKLRVMAVSDGSMMDLPVSFEGGGPLLGFGANHFGRGMLAVEIQGARRNIVRVFGYEPPPE